MTEDFESSGRFVTLKGDVDELVKRLDREDFNRYQPLYAEEVRNQIERYKELLERHVFQKHHEAFAVALEGLVRAHVSLAIREIVEAKRAGTPKQAHKAAKTKGDASKDLTRKVAQEKRGSDGEPLSPSQLVKHVQAERLRLGMKSLGKSRDGGEVASDSALKAVSRHLKGYRY